MAYVTIRKIASSPASLTACKPKKQRKRNSWHYSHKTSNLPKQCQLNLHKTEEGGIPLVTAGAMDIKSMGNTTAKPGTAEKKGTKQEQLGAIQWEEVRITKIGKVNLDREKQQELTTAN